MAISIRILIQLFLFPGGMDMFGGGGGAKTGDY
jgi:hypothetical protein